MDPNSYQPGFQYGLQQFNLAPPSTATAPPMQTMHMPVGVGSEGEASFNDSGYFSSPPRSHFTNLTNQLRGTNPAQQTASHARRASPTKQHGTAVSDLMGAPRPSWQEDFPSVSDEWDKNFINNFEENLFGFDASDLNHMVDGILGSPYKSSMASPFSSPRQSHSAAAGLGLSPFSASNLMLAPKRSPVRLGGSPFRSPFSSPSPVKGLNSHTRTSPMTRQRRLILQSPVRSESLADQFSDLPHFLNIKEEQTDETGVVPFQRTNSFGFTPQDDVSSSPPFSSFYEDSVLQTTQPGFSGQRFQDINNTTPVRQGKRVKTEVTYGLDSSASKSLNYNLRSSPSSQGYGFNYKLRNSPSKSDSFGFKPHSPSKRQSLAQGRISVTHHAQLINELPPKDALRLVRARFKEVLDKATADAAVKEINLKTKLKSRAKKQVQYPEISQALSRPVSAAGGKDAQDTTTYTQIQPHRPAGKRRQEILPKPSPDWPRREPCKIAPKKRKR
ncbi:uncharacterized protein [Littorina saxatilis]|uniref:Uncharacterized protein n=1 Tax=Littorina saxatilis TaxID=31220 RepID=A0AAN9GB74_9CAEN